MKQQRQRNFATAGLAEKQTNKAQRPLVKRV
jgi:hypothetical protein